MSMRWGQLYKGTPAEKSLEDAVASLGVPYRTQFPGYLYGVRYFVDFLLPTLGLVIEVDDDSHRRADKIASDAERTATLEREWNVIVVRCTNRNALEDPHGTLRAMLSSVGLWPLPTRLPNVATSLPQLRSAPQKARREQKAEARQEKRKGSRGRRPRAGLQDHKTMSESQTPNQEAAG